MALAHPTPLPFPQAESANSFFQPQQQDLMVEFAEQFTQLQGKFVYCLNEEEFREQYKKLEYQNQWTKVFCSETALIHAISPNILHADLETCQASLTSCELLVARTGSIVLSSSGQGRLPSVYAPIHVCVARSSQLVYDLKDGLQGLQKKYGSQLPSSISFATGPSRTADIEKTLVVGVHGPKEVYCFVIEDQQ